MNANNQERRAVESFPEIKNSKRVTVDGVEYLIQRLPNRAALELRESWGQDKVKMIDSVLEHFIVSPKVELEDFADIVTVETLVAEALKYQYIEKGKTNLHTS